MSKQEYPPVLQTWLTSIPVMQQAVMLNCMRGADGIAKYDPSKYLLRWYRRCILRMALTYTVCKDPCTIAGASYMGPSFTEPPDYDGHWEPHMDKVVDGFIRQLDMMPHHFVQHFRHGVEILGYKHEDRRIRAWWHGVYLRLVNDEHLHPETEAEMDKRLGDRYDTWRERCDDAVVD